jgi:hypothetical protein
MNHKSLSYEYNKIKGLLDKQEQDLNKKEAQERQYQQRIKDLEDKIQSQSAKL